MTSVDRPPAPIAIMSFNRPDYLRQVLESLVAQENGRLEEREIILFQDGSFNAFSGIDRADSKDIDASIAVFESILPGRRVERSLHNIGVALNYDRAERYFFEERAADAAIFLEDDLVLASSYLQAIESLLEVARHDARIGYVAAYGHHWVPLSEQVKNPGRYVLLEHNWAFALMRRQWLQNKPYVDQYLALVRQVDYRDRNRKAIHKLYHSWGMGVPGDSQDVTKTMACCLAKSVKLNTTVCLGRYIGAHGLHMTPAMYEARKYPKTEIFTGDLPTFGPLQDADYNRIFAPQLNWAIERPYVE